MSPGVDLAVSVVLGVATALNLRILVRRWRRSGQIMWFHGLIIILLLATLGMRVSNYRLAAHIADTTAQISLLQATLDTIKTAQADRTGTTTYLIHRPAEGCPAGWGLAAGIFTEKDGSHEDACALGHGAQGAIDVLKGGESVRVPVLLPVPARPPAGSDQST